MKLFVIALSWLLASCGAEALEQGCKCFPGDSCWPSTDGWSTLNDTIGGRLVATVPLGSPCHDPSYDAEACERLQAQWQAEAIHMASSSSVMAPFFANQSCDPFQPESRACLLGNYVRYAVNSSSTEDIQATIAFAVENNIRFVIRNTGHDYLGRSTGAGALAIWTHYLKSIEFQNFTSEAYTGPAVTVGAGVQGYEILEAARDVGLVAVGGECPTVGLAGGYTQGGGHSALSTSFGLSADNTLSFEVVLANGTLLTASRTQNSDLYWAMSGGGGGTFGVVVSMTVRAHPDEVFSGASLSFFTTDNEKEAFYEGIQAFHETLPAMVDAGTMVQSLIMPFLTALDSLNINYTVAYTEFPTYYDHFNEYYGPLPLSAIEVGIAQYGARLIPRAVVADISSTMRSIVEQGVTWIGVGTNVEPFGSNITNSVLPAWRDAIVHTTLTLPWNFTAPWEEMLALQDLMTDTIMPEIEAATPGSGSYVNEADFRQPNFQEVFWGSNYEALLAIKEVYDPEGFFWVTKGVGSEAWEVTEDGRMCKARLQRVM